jgi:ferredoxin
VAERVLGGLTVRIDELLCVGFGDCVTAAPDAFVVNGDGVVEFAAPERVAPDALIEACRVCPVDALTVLDGSGTQLVP